MDPLTLAFYAIVCGLLSAVAPRMPKLAVRLIVGAVAGIVAAGLLPAIRGALGL